MYIVLSGTHGIGKTTLAKRLAEELGAVHLTESIDEAIPPPPLGVNGNALLSELWFVRQMILKEAQMKDAKKIYVSDRGWADISAYANVLLDEHARNIFRSVYDHLPKQLPDVHIIVDAPIDVVTSRIRARNRTTAVEWNEFDIDFLQNVMNEFTKFHSAYKDLRPVHLLDVSGSVEENLKSAVELVRPHLSPR